MKLTPSGKELAKYPSKRGYMNNVATERGDNQYRLKMNKHMMSTLSPNQGNLSSRANLVDPKKVHILKQIEFY